MLGHHEELPNLQAREFSYLLESTLDDDDDWKPQRRNRRIDRTALVQMSSAPWAARVRKESTHDD